MAEGGLPNAGTGGGGYVIYRAWILKLTSPPSTALFLLIAIIAELQAVIERLQRRIARTGGPGETGRPAPNARPQGEIGPEAPSAAGAPQAATPRLRPPAHDTDPSGGARDGELPRLRRPPVRRLDPAHSGSHRAAGGSGASHRARLPIARTCPACRRRCTPPAVLDGVVLGQQRLGVNLLSLIATLREEGRLPIRSVQWYLDTVHQLRLSVGAIVSIACHSPDRAAGPTSGGRDPNGPHPRQPSGPRRRNRLARCLENIGANGYVWTFSTWDCGNGSSDRDRRRDRLFRC